MEWRIIPEFPRYEASDTGLIRNIRTGTIRKCTWGGPARCRYLRVGVDGRRSKKLVHRLVLLAFVGSPPEGKPYGLHKNGDRSNNAISNLYWGSGSENSADAKHHLGGKWQANGERSGPAKLTDKQAKEILDRYRAVNGKRGIQSQLAREYGVCVSTVNYLVRGVWWSWLHGDNQRSRS